MPCQEFLSFYETLPVSILAAVSIFAIFFLYFLQQQGRQLGNIRISIGNLRKSSDEFQRITNNLMHSLHTRPPPNRAEGETLEDAVKELDIPLNELIEMRGNLINDWNRFESNKEGFRFFMKILVDLEILQTSIYDKFIYTTRDFRFDDLSEIDINTFEQWINRFVLLLKEIEGIETGMVSLIEPITDIYRQTHKEWNPRLDEDTINDFVKFYGSFFMKTDENKKGAEIINDKIYYYYKNWFNAILASYYSRVCLYLVICIIILFGLIIPLYLIQPIQIDMLTCNTVFYINVFLLIIINFILILASYLLRYKTQSVLNVRVSQNHNARNGLPNNIQIESKNNSRTPLFEHKIDCDIYLNETKIRSKTLFVSLEQYGVKIDTAYNVTDLRILHENENRDKELKLLIKQYSYWLRFRDSNFFIKKEKSFSYKWNESLLEWEHIS